MLSESGVNLSISNDWGWVNFGELQVKLTLVKCLVCNMTSSWTLDFKSYWLEAWTQSQIPLNACDLYVCICMLQERGLDHSDGWATAMLWPPSSNHKHQSNWRLAKNWGFRDMKQFDCDRVSIDKDAGVLTNNKSVAYARCMNFCNR